VLRLENIVLSRGGKTIVERASPAADRGDIVALLGANGAGKTTLLHFIAGILKGDSGDIYFDENKVETTSLDWRRRLSYVLDDGGTIPLLTMAEQLYLQCVLAGIGPAESVERTRLVVDLLELGRYRDYRGDELSAGLRKRLGIGIGIIRDADVFLFDEPFGSLDVQATAVFGRILATLKRRQRIVIVASHSFPFLSDLCNHIWALSDRVLTAHSEKGQVASLLDHPFQSGSMSSQEADIPWIRKST
jgi:ABC-type multidrug transport system ATPase subunit